MPTVLLSNHPARWPLPRRAHLARQLGQIGCLDANGWLEPRAVLTGDLPATEHVTAAKAALARVRAENPAGLYLCDPVFGDEPDGLYLDEATADAIGQHLIPLCDVATPNLFELEWLADVEASDLDSAFWGRPPARRPACARPPSRRPMNNSRRCSCTRTPRMRPLCRGGRPLRMVRAT